MEPTYDLAHLSMREDAKRSRYRGWEDRSLQVLWLSVPRAGRRRRRTGVHRRTGGRTRTIDDMESAAGPAVGYRRRERHAARGGNRESPFHLLPVTVQDNASPKFAQN